jgi:cytochrome c peroxidase
MSEKRVSGFTQEKPGTPFKTILRVMTLTLPALFLLQGTAHSHKADGKGDEASRAALITPAGYEAPPPGSYRLPPIQAAVDGDVVDSHGVKHRLFEVMGDEYVVLSFIYTACADPRGCPLATFTLNIVRMRLEKNPNLADKVRFVTLSFDPERDKPPALVRYARHLGFEEARRSGRWRFLTTTSKESLKPILDGYGQYVVREFDENGKHTGHYSHVLKVYLIDPQHKVRNIYSTSFLYPDLIVNDIKTLMLERSGPP